jgi:salicylate hydroxylase
MNAIPKTLQCSWEFLGLTAAMALAKFSPESAPPKIRVFEIRPKPGVIGGAVNLTPNALRLLDRLDVLPIMRENDYGLEIDCIEVFSVYQPVQLGESSFRGPEGKGLGDPPYKVRSSFEYDHYTC